MRLPEEKTTVEFTGNIDDMIIFLNRLKSEYLDVNFKGKYSSLVMNVIIYEEEDENHS